MSSIADSIRERVARLEWLDRAEVDACIASEDIVLWSAVYIALKQKHWRIHPEIRSTEGYSFILRYLVRCIRDDPQGENVLGGYEAAYCRAGWLKVWAESLPQAEVTMKLAEKQIATAYLAGDAAVRDRFVCGTLEHDGEGGHSSVLCALARRTFTLRRMARRDGLGDRAR